MQRGSYQFETLASQEMESTQLRERAQLRLAGFTELLNRHRFPPQGKVLEVGCAHGLRTHHMATHFPQAKVIGIDRSLELLKIAQDTFEPTPNLSFQYADLYDLPFSDHSFDFIYARLIFMHLSEPMLALQHLKRLLRPGGKILIEDADRDCMFFEPQPASFKFFWSKVQNSQRGLGGDPNVGRKLGVYLKSAAFKNLDIEVQTIIGSGEEISFLVQTLMPSLNLYLKPEDREEGIKAIADLAELAKNPQACFYHFWYVVSAER